MKLAPGSCYFAENRPLELTTHSAVRLLASGQVPAMGLLFTRFPNCPSFSSALLRISHYLKVHMCRKQLASEQRLRLVFAITPLST